MNHVYCYYCKKVCRKIFDDITKVSSYQCDYHGAVRVRHLSLVNPNHLVTLVVLYKEGIYHFNFYHYSDGKKKFRLDKIHPYPQTNQVILDLDFHPDVTPDNAKQKIATMILFS